MTIKIFEPTTRGAEILLELQKEEFSRGLLPVIAEMAARIENIEKSAKDMEYIFFDDK